MDPTADDCGTVPQTSGNFPARARMKHAVWTAEWYFGRWFPGAWAIIIFALPLAAFTVYAARSSEGLYHLEIKLAADRPVDNAGDL